MQQGKETSLMLHDILSPEVSEMIMNLLKELDYNQQSQLITNRTLLSLKY